MTTRRPKEAEPDAGPHRWAFTRRLRARAFGWRTPPAVAAVKAAVSEIKKVARKDPVHAGEGAVIFFERVADAIYNVDGSSGGMGAAVNRAVEALSQVVANAPIDIPTRAAWLDRLWLALEADERPYLEQLGHAWGRMCAGTELAAQWGERCAPEVRRVFGDPRPTAGYPNAISVCLSSLLAAGRHQEIVDLVALHRIAFWPDRKYAVRALALMGRVDDALNAAAACRDDAWEEGDTIASVCEEILISAGRADEAYERFAFRSAFAGTSSAVKILQALRAKYPAKATSEVVADLVKASPDNSAAWTEAAKTLGVAGDQEGRDSGG
jgi:hypothetical protein